MTGGRKIRIVFPTGEETRRYPRRWWRPWEKRDTYTVTTSWITVCVYVSNPDNPHVIVESDPPFKDLGYWSWHPALQPMDVAVLNVEIGPIFLHITEPFTSPIVMPSSLEPPYGTLRWSAIDVDRWEPDCVR